MQHCELPQFCTGKRKMQSINQDTNDEESAGVATCMQPRSAPAGNAESSQATSNQNEVAEAQAQGRASLPDENANKDAKEKDMDAVRDHKASFFSSGSADPNLNGGQEWDSKTASGKLKQQGTLYFLKPQGNTNEKMVVDKAKLLQVVPQPNNYDESRQGACHRAQGGSGRQGALNFLKPQGNTNEKMMVDQAELLQVASQSNNYDESRPGAHHGAQGGSLSRTEDLMFSAVASCRLSWHRRRCAWSCRRCKQSRKQCIKLGSCRSKSSSR